MKKVIIFGAVAFVCLAGFGAYSYLTAKDSLDSIYTKKNTIKKNKEAKRKIHIEEFSRKAPPLAPNEKYTADATE